MIDTRPTTLPPPSKPEGWDFFAAQIARKLGVVKRKNRLRKLRPLNFPYTKLDLTHNDYLGLRQATALRQEIVPQLAHIPFGSGGSRLLGGEWESMRSLEQAFAAYVGFEDALFFPSGYAANESLTRALYSPSAAIFSDKLNHASIIDGIKIAGFPDNRKHIFRHNDLDDLGALLHESAADYNVIFTESLFSMDGDFAPLAKMSQIAQENRGILVVDEAHSLGVYGPQGRGSLYSSNIDKSKIIGVFPCGKALGSQGAFVAGPSWLRSFLINHARAFIYTTAPSPWIVAALQKVVAALPSLERERAQLHAYSMQLRQHLKKTGWPILDGNSHIVPIIVGSEENALKWEEKFYRKGIILRAIRPPTVPPGQCRLRLSLNASIQEKEFIQLLEVFSYYASP